MDIRSIRSPEWLLESPQFDPHSFARFSDLLRFTRLHPQLYSPFTTLHYNYCGMHLLCVMDPGAWIQVMPMIILIMEACQFRVASRIAEAIYVCVMCENLLSDSGGIFSDSLNHSWRRLTCMVHPQQYTCCICMSGLLQYTMQHAYCCG